MDDAGGASLEACRQSQRRLRAAHDDGAASLEQTGNQGRAVDALIQTPEFEALREELPGLQARLNSVQSVTIGVNVTQDLRPESATILSVDTEKVEGRGGLLARLFGRQSTSEGITRLRAGPGAAAAEARNAMRALPASA